MKRLDLDINPKKIRTSVLVYGILLVGLLLQSCMNSNIKNQNTSWKTSRINIQVDWILPNEHEIDNIKNLIKIYNKYPYDQKYTRLLFNKLLIDKSKTTKFYLFDVEYVDDIHIVFKLNKKNDIIDKFIISDWSNKGDEGINFQ